jgi:glycosyltransferase involved in cell wall biosynthesis
MAGFIAGPARGAQLLAARSRIAPRLSQPPDAGLVWTPSFWYRPRDVPPVSASLDDPAADHAPRPGGVLLLGPVPPPPAVGGIANGIGLLRQTPLAAASGMGFLNTFRAPDPRRSPLERSRYQCHAYSRFLATLARCRPGLVHVKTSGWTNFYQNAGYCLLARAARRPTLLQIHDGTFPAFFRQASPARQRLIRRLAHVPHTIIALSDSWASYYRETLGVQSIVVVPNGLPVAALHDVPANRTRLGIGPGRVAVLFMGTQSAALDEEKGFSELVTAVAGLRARYPELLLVVAGAASHTARLTAQLGPEGEGWLALGAVDTALRAVTYRSVDVFALPSHAENMPNTVLEAMAAGCAIVASAVGAVPEMLAEQAGRVVPVQDAPALQHALAELVASPARRRELGSRAAARAAARYDLPVVERALRALYESMVPGITTARGTPLTPLASRRDGANAGTSPGSRSGT